MNKKKLRGAVIGYGFISARGHVPAYVERNQNSGDVEIVAVADICRVRRNSAQEALPHAAVYAEYRELLKAEASNLDFVDICTPPHDHAAIAHAALAAGFHVLCEKPLTRTTAEARALLDHAKAVRRVLFPCHNYRHAPAITAIGEIIKSGQIGKVHSVSLNTYRDTHAKGITANSDWRRESRYSGGGIAMDHGSHSFYLTFDWLGSYPISVNATMSNLEPGKYDTEDEFTALLTFPTGVARVHLTWTAGIRKAIYSLRGEKGSITMEDNNLQIESLNGSNGCDSGNAASRHVESRLINSDWSDASHAGWFNALFDEFREAIDHGEFAGQQAREALLCVQLINTAYRSAREGSRELSLGEA